MSHRPLDDLLREAMRGSPESKWAPDAAAAHADFRKRIQQNRVEPAAARGAGDVRRDWMGPLSAAASVAVVVAVSATVTLLARQGGVESPQLASAPERSPAVSAPPAQDLAQSKSEDGSSSAHGSSSGAAEKSSVGHPYNPQRVCGPGYRVIDQHALTRSVVYLLWNPSTEQNCVVTLKTRDVGRKTSTTAYLQADGAPRVTDSGRFSHYAGPVRQKAPSCVTWGGSDGVGAAFVERGHCNS